MSEQIIKLESALQKFQNNLSFAQKCKNKHKMHIYQSKIIDIERQIKEVELKNPVESIARLHKINDDLKAQINSLETNRELLIVELKKRKNHFDRIVNSEPEPILTTQPIILIDEPEAEPETEEKIPCPDCGTMVTGERGLQTHQSRWCKSRGVKAEVKLNE